jgi:hypothetical protein
MVAARYARDEPAPESLRSSPMPTFRQVDPSAMLKPVVPKGRRQDPELDRMVKKIRTITDNQVVYEVTLEDGEKAATVRQKLLKASSYVGLMTPARRSTRGRKPRTA